MENDAVGEQLRLETAQLQAKLASVQQLHRAVTEVLLDERGQKPALTMQPP